MLALPLPHFLAQKWTAYACQSKYDKISLIKFLHSWCVCLLCHLLSTKIYFMMTNRTDVETNIPLLIDRRLSIPSNLFICCCEIEIELIQLTNGSCIALKMESKKHTVYTQYSSNSFWHTHTMQRLDASKHFMTSISCMN